STRSLWSIKMPSFNKGTDVSLHSFPHEKTRRKQWEDACGRVQLPKDPRLCSSHFSASESYSSRVVGSVAEEDFSPHSFDQKVASASLE
uniref:THAP-type domain-containing protein n=1 Tax=Haplochromis burtoni TaxID=8153 RepID=A0A3Q3CMQ6_HAPBU